VLITRRRQGESLIIADSIEVVVLELGQGRVKLGVVAPPEVTVERKEWRLVRDENKSALETAVSPFVRGMLANGAADRGNVGMERWRDRAGESTNDG
jgi:carbon storage regulator